MRLQSQRCLVTGAGGFIGSHLVEALVQRGATVRALVHYNSFNFRGWLERIDPHMQREIEVLAGDVRDPHGVHEAMTGCEVVFHLAALIGIPYSYRSPAAYVDTNIMGTLNVVQAARDLGIERIVQTSTSEVYGTALSVPIAESHPLQGQSPYSASKIGADQIAMSFHSSFAAPVAIVRPFNTYGPRQSLRAVIPTVISQIAHGRSRIRLGSLEPTRDFNYVLDTVRGFLAVAECDQAVGEVVNLGSNYEISIGDTVQMIAELMQVDVAVETETSRLRPEKSEVQRLWADNSKARQLTGWQPEYAGREGLREGLALTVQWLREPENLRGYKPDTYNI